MTLATADRVGRRRTRQREAILEAVRSTTVHPDAQWVYDAVRQQMPRVSLGTVYRNLSLLAQHGLIRQIPTVGGYARFDGNLLPHGHLVCLRCDRIEDLPLDDNFEGLQPGAVASGFRNLSLQVRMRGICPSCYNGLQSLDRD